MTDKIEEKELSPFEKFHAYMRGWKDGCCSRAPDRRYTEHKDRRFNDLYQRGLRDGTTDRTSRQKMMMARFGYQPSPLRLHDEELVQRIEELVRERMRRDGRGNPAPKDKVPGGVQIVIVGVPRKLAVEDADKAVWTLLEGTGVVLESEGRIVSLARGSDHLVLEMVR